MAFALSFSRWLCARPELYRLPVTLSSAGPVAPGDLITTGSLVSVPGWLGKWAWVWAGPGVDYSLGSCGVGLSIALTGSKGWMARAVMGSSCEQNGAILRP